MASSAVLHRWLRVREKRFIENVFPATRFSLHTASDSGLYEDSLILKYDEEGILQQRYDLTEEEKQIMNPAASFDERGAQLIEALKKIFVKTQDDMDELMKAAHSKKNKTKKITMKEYKRRQRIEEKWRISDAMQRLEERRATAADVRILDDIIKEQKAKARAKKGVSAELKMKKKLYVGDIKLRF